MSDQELLPEKVEEKETSLSEIADIEKLEEQDKVFEDLVEVGMSNMEDVEALGIQSEHPRAVEVFAGYLKTIADINEKRVDLIKAKNKMLADLRKGKSGGEESLPGGTNIDKAIFVGTTKELLGVLNDD